MRDSRELDQLAVSRTLNTTRATGQYGVPSNKHKGLLPAYMDQGEMRTCWGLAYGTLIL